MSYKEHWAYKKVKECGYKTKITKTKVQILFQDGEIFADFKLVKDDEEDMYFIYCNGEMINDELDAYRTYDDAVGSCFYYFVTRF